MRSRERGGDRLSEVERVELSDSVTIYRGDCREVLPGLGGVDAVVTDPPYGMDWSFSGQGSGTNARGSTRSVTKGLRIAGDGRAFDPAPLMSFDRCIIWGFHHFSHRLPPGSVLVWLKRHRDAYGSFLSDADLAWMKGGCGVYCSRVIHPASFQAEKCHPTQKPVDLMAWCMDRAKVPAGGVTADPYMGSGTTGVACIRTGRAFVGIEIDATYFAVARKRLETELAQRRLL